MTISKKVLIPVILILCAAFFCGGFWTQKLLSGQAMQANAPADTDADEISLLDAAHEQRLAEAVSNVETEDVNEEYVQKYKELISRYHEQLMSVATKDLQTSLPQEQEAWENYVQTLLDMQMDYYEENFYGGSVPPVLITDFEYDLYKQRALLFQEICENITSIADIRRQHEHVPITRESMNKLGFDIAPQNKSLIELTSRTYGKSQLVEIAAFDGSMEELNAQYPIECLREDNGVYRVSYLGDGSAVILLFDHLGNCLLGNLYGARRLKVDFDGLKSLEDVRAIDPDGVFLLLDTRKESMPKASSHHCTKDGYLITIEYDASNAIMSMKEELI